MATANPISSPGSVKVDRLGRPVKHGMHNTPEYRVWQQMKHRCLNPRSQRYDRYGARGITVCERWLSFEGFYADMGPRPSAEHSLERIDNDGHYCPENCRWATRAEQNRNRSDNVILEHDGRRMTLTEWAKELRMNPRTLACRIEAGRPAEEALTTPVAPREWHGRWAGYKRKGGHLRRTLEFLRGHDEARAYFADKHVRIWSGQWKRWWLRQPDGSACGYTSEVSEAGIFPFPDAWDRSCHCGPEKKIVYEIVGEEIQEQIDAGIPREGGR